MSRSIHSFNNPLTATDELSTVIDNNPHLATHRAVMASYNKRTGQVIKVTNTTVDQAIKYMENACSEDSRDQTEHYWDCYDSASGCFRRGYVSHIPHNAEVGYMVDLIEDTESAEATKKSWLSIEAGLVRMPPFSPTMLDAFEGRDFDPNKLANEAKKFKEYRNLAMKGVK